MKRPVMPLIIRLSPLLIFAVLWLPRAFSLTQFVTPDEPRWLTRSANFYQALATGDFAATYQTEHPGVTTMWSGLLGFVLTFPDYPTAVPGQMGTTDDPIKGFLEANGHTPLAVLGAARGVVVLVVSLTLTATVMLLIAQLGWPVGLAALALIAFDPFSLAHARVLHTDALLASFMLLALVAFSQSLRASNPRRTLILSGIGTGLAVLTKTPGVLVVAYIGLIYLVHKVPLLSAPERENQEAKKRVATHWLGIFWGDLLRPLLPWAVAALATFVLLWPALWVTPLDVLKQMLVESQSYAEEGHSSALFYLGELKWGNPGLSFYPLAYLWRTTPLTLVGLGLLLLSMLLMSLRALLPGCLAPRGQASEHGVAGAPERAFIIQMVGFALFYGVIMSLGAKKFDRYLLPSFIPLSIGAAAGWMWLVLGLSRSILAKRSTRGRMALAVCIVGVLAIGQAASALPTFPYYLPYYNPLMRWSHTVTDEMLVGWGEGLDVAARRIAAEPNAAQAKVAAWYTHGPTSWLHPGIPLSTEKFWEADYLLLYQNQIQRDTPARQMLLHYLRQEPAQKVTLNGIDYAWLYRVADVPLPPTVVEWNQQIRLVNYTLTAGDITAGQEVELALYLVNQAPIEENLNILVRIISADGVELQREDRWPFGSSTKNWPVGETWVDRIKFNLPTDVPPDLYRVEVSFYDPASLERLPSVTVATGEPIGDPLILDYLSVNLLENGQSLGLDGGPLNFGEQLQLRSVALIDKDGNPVADSSTSPSVPQSTAWQAGDSIQLDITWQTLKMSAMPLTGFVHMTGPSGELVAQDDHPVIHDFIPHTMWSPWQRLPDRFMLQLPDDAALGDYTLFIGLYHPETGQRLTFDVDGQQQDALRWMSIPVR